ncbi:LysM peptidoglycan-binding domain-containing protein [Muricoccus vinaceus]|uniref:LysM peptidoglycan-binding domain-containing protein n=1 Tax=Muricoccus vinaceus TaxID=424704 RepID=A0ABV6IMK3_9PROT
MTDASRLRVAGGAAVLACTVAVGTYYGTRDRPPAVSSAGRVPDQAQAGARLLDQAGPRFPAPGSAPPASAEAPRAAPRFDVVRMGARGMVVVAGRAAPGAEVALHDGGREIGRARADSRGEWVILPAEPLPSGARELSLRSRIPGGEELQGPDTVLVVGPAPAGPEIAAATAPPRGASGAGPAGDAGPRPPAAEAPLVLLMPPTGAAAPRTLSPRERPAALGLDVVDYDAGNAMRFAGTAPPGARLRLYADDRHLGDAVADEAGRWSLVPPLAPGMGRHTLRVDQIAPAGRGGPRGALAGRIEVAFQRETLPTGALEKGRVVVQPGHNLWRIARDTYGQGTRYTVIFRANQEQIRNPARIYPGQVFSVPGAP